MRALFQKDLSIQDSYLIRGDAAHHLVNVVRVEMDEEILLLNGAGLTVKTQVSSLSKKEIILKCIASTTVNQNIKMDLALGIPKKEALELCLKQAVELGFRKIYLIRSDYSQTRLPEMERLESLIISAIEQSNSAFMPEICPMSWDKIPVSDYGEILMMDSQSDSQNDNMPKNTDPKLLIVGPEGGFSKEERDFLHKLPNIRILNLPTPILRTPTAVSAGAGIILGSLLD
jgi:16S rRNA (uracil1498-N3)-methyltransferase